MKRVDAIVSWETEDEATGEMVRQYNSYYTYIHEDSEWYER